MGCAGSQPNDFLFGENMISKEQKEYNKIMKNIMTINHKDYFGDFLYDVKIFLFVLSVLFTIFVLPALVMIIGLIIIVKMIT